MEYVLRTIKDISDLVPESRVEDCMKELTVSIIQSQKLRGLFQTVDAPIVFPDNLVWKDDGKGEISIGVKYDNKQICRVDTLLK